LAGIDSRGGNGSEQTLGADTGIDENGRSIAADNATVASAPAAGVQAARTKLNPMNIANQTVKCLFMSASLKQTCPCPKLDEIDANIICPIKKRNPIIALYFHPPAC